MKRNLFLAALATWLLAWAPIGQVSALDFHDLSQLVRSMVPDDTIANLVRQTEPLIITEDQAEELLELGASPMVIEMLIVAPFDFNELRELIANGFPEESTYDVVTEHLPLYATISQASELRALGASDALVAMLTVVPAGDPRLDGGRIMTLDDLEPPQTYGTTVYQEVPIYIPYEPYYTEYPFGGIIFYDDRPRRSPRPPSYGHRPDERPRPPGGQGHPPHQRPDAPGGRPPGGRPRPPAEKPKPPAERPKPPAEKPRPPGLLPTPEQPGPPSEKPRPPAVRPPVERPHPPAERPRPPSERPRPPSERPRPPAERPGSPAERPHPPAERPKPPSEKPRPPVNRPRPPAETERPERPERPDRPRSPHDRPRSGRNGPGGGQSPVIEQEP